jgi:hypothetical protein
MAFKNQLLSSKCALKVFDKKITQIETRDDDDISKLN